MIQAEAEALAAKRERHKPKSLHHKNWKAVHCPVKGWHVALVDNVAVIERQNYAEAKKKADAAILSGDVPAFLDAASDAFLAKCRIQIAETAL